jgi:hypothetical protein
VTGGSDRAVRSLAAHRSPTSRSSSSARRRRLRLASGASTCAERYETRRLIHRRDAATGMAATGAPAARPWRRRYGPHALPIEKLDAGYVLTCEATSDRAKAPIRLHVSVQQARSGSGYGTAARTLWRAPMKLGRPVGLLMGLRRSVARRRSACSALCVQRRSAEPHRRAPQTADIDRATTRSAGLPPR